MTQKPRDEEIRPETPADEKAIEEFAKDPETAHPKVDGHPSWESKETSKWPMYVGFGLLVGLLAVGLIAGWLKHTPPPEESSTTMEKMAMTSVVTKAADLETDSTYQISEVTPMVTEAGGDEKQAGTILQPKVKIGVVDSKMVGDVKWYYVKAYDDKQNVIGTGWISSKALEGQSLQRMGAFKLELQPVGAPNSDGE